MSALLPSRGLAELWRNDRRSLLHELLLLLIGLGFLFPNEPTWSDLFYVGIMPLFCWSVWKGDFRSAVANWPGPLVAGEALIGVFLVSILLNTHSVSMLGLSFFWIWNVLCTGLFVFLLTDAFAMTRAFRQRLMQVMIGCGVVNVCIALAKLCFVPLEWQGDVLRMQGWGLTRHPILGAIIMGSVLLMAVHRALSTAQRRYWVAALVTLGFIVLTGSRGPLLSVLAGLVVLIGMRRPQLMLLFTLAALVLGTGIWFLDGGVLSQIVREQFARGDSHRFRIWALSWQHIEQAFWLGHGPTWKLALPGETFPHNLLLSTWLYAGFIGVLALLAYLCTVLKSLFTVPDYDQERPLCLAVLTHTLLSAMTDFGQVIKGPAPMWYIFWLATLFAAHISARRQA